MKHKVHSFYLLILLAAVCFSGLSLPLQAQRDGFVRASGKQILDIHGENLVLRGIGTGNWVLQEGYMMNSSEVAGTQWKFKQKLIETIGEERTDEFYQAWWDNHFRKIDVDSMARWGFNSVRVAMHYKQFTLPIEEEPVQGQHTWLEDGFVRIDNLLNWCAENQLYLILDMHGTPGGQGTDANISDYDPSKPSLWESEENKLKLIALWKELAKRYADSPWIGGYDLINEPNWTLPNNNRDLWDLYKRITSAIREVDKNHLLFLGGNWWGNDYGGLPVLWDDNMALSFHKYWTYNDTGSIQWMIDLRNQRNVPIWLGETGENSNTWFADLVALCESNTIGWSWWPVKKTGINNILQSKSNADYNRMLNAWKQNSSINADVAYRGVMQFAEDHKFENCTIKHDVIDALITRPHTTESRPFKPHTVSHIIYAVDYDLGPSGCAYYDVDDADYHLNTDSYVNWNKGWVYRNDGVDIESCTDSQTNGYAVGWIEDGEWLQYTIESAQAKAYAVQLRYASQQGGGRVYVEINGSRASKSIELPSTGDWKSWKTLSIPNVIIPAGSFTLRLVFEKAGFNLNYLKFAVPREVGDIPFELLDAVSHRFKDEIILTFNKQVDAVADHSFEVAVNGQTVSVSSINKEEEQPTELVLQLSEEILDTDNITISYQGETCLSGGKDLVKFQNQPVQNKQATLHRIPVHIEAEEYFEKSGFTFEECSDLGGGLNAGYTQVGNYLDYFVYADYAGEYDINLRVSVNAKSRLALYDVDEKNTLLRNLELNATGGWQNWKTQQTTVNLKKGKNILRVYAITDGFNFNWLEIRETENSITREESSIPVRVEVYPNPTTDKLHVVVPMVGNWQMELVNPLGESCFTRMYDSTCTIEVDVNRLLAGFYLLRVQADNGLVGTSRVIVAH